MRCISPRMALSRYYEYFIQFRSLELVEYKAATTMFAYKRRATWKVVFWEQSGVHGSSMDWLCPKCNQAIHTEHSNLRRCPKCGLSVGEIPVFRESLPRSIRNKEWLAWYFNEVDDQPVESLRRNNGRMGR
jgi:hypothetical protein